MRGEEGCRFVGGRAGGRGWRALFKRRATRSIGRAWCTSSTPAAQARGGVGTGGKFLSRTRTTGGGAADSRGEGKIEAARCGGAGVHEARRFSWHNVEVGCERAARFGTCDRRAYGGGSLKDIPAPTKARLGLRSREAVAGAKIDPANRWPRGRSAGVSNPLANFGRSARL